MELSQAKVIVNVVEVEPCVMKLQLEMPAERADAIYRKVRKAVTSRVSLPGFRAGKMPPALIEKHFGARIIAEAMDEIVQTAYKEGLAETELPGRIVGSPSLESAPEKYEAGQPVKCEVRVEVNPKITIPEYKGLALTKEKHTVTDQEVEDRLNSFAEMGSSYQEAQKAAEENDMLELGYEATIPEGMEISDKSSYLVKAENTWIALHEPEVLPGCVKALMGISAGEERDVTIAFPEDFAASDELKGKSLQYHFKVKSVRTKQRPALDDEFAKRFGMPSIEEMRKVIRNVMEREENEKEQNSLAKQIIDKLLEGQDFPLPPTQLNNVIEHSIQNRNEQLKKRGLSEEELKAKLEDAEELQELKDHVAKYLRQMLILDAIAKQENIGVSQDDLLSVASSFQREVGDGRANLSTVVKEKSSTGEFQAAIQNVRDSRTIAKIIELANITETEVPAKA